MKYAERFLRNGRHEEAIQAARDDWVGSDFNRGERDDPYYTLCFRQSDPLDDVFASIAIDIFRPLTTYREKAPQKKR